MISPWIKLVLAISLDGRLSFTPSQKMHLGGEGDRKVLEDALAWSDATLMGAETLRIHKSTCLIHNQKLIKQRKSNGLNPQPTCLVVSEKVDFDEHLPFFDQPIKRWLITNKEKANSHFEFKGFHNQVIMKEDWFHTLENLNKQGISKITLLGGAILINSLLLEDRVDELQLTIVPKVLGGKNSWTPYKENNLPIDINNLDSWILKDVRNLGKNEIMVRYHRNRKQKYG